MLEEGHWFALHIAVSLVIFLWAYRYSMFEKPYARSEFREGAGLVAAFWLPILFIGASMLLVVGFAKLGEIVLIEEKEKCDD